MPAACKKVLQLQLGYATDESRIFSQWILTNNFEASVFFETKLALCSEVFKSTAVKGCSLRLYTRRTKKTDRTKYSVFKIVIFVNKTLIIFHFLGELFSHCVIKCSTKNSSNLQKKSRHPYQLFRSHL